MNITAIAIASIGLASAASVAAAAPVSDVDYLKASRCHGIAVSLGADSTAIGAYLKAASVGRQSYIIDRGEQEFAKAKRQGAGDGKARLEAELTGACSAYMAPDKTLASR